MAYEAKRKRLEKQPEAQAADTPKERYRCYRCGTSYSRQQSFFPISHSAMYRSEGYLPWCSACIDKMYAQYKRTLGERGAMRRLCMKMDLYWSDDLFDMSEKSNKTVSRPKSYISKTNLMRFVDKTFDDTLKEEALAAQKRQAKAALDGEESPGEASNIAEISGEMEEDYGDGVSAEVIQFWGSGYDTEMYKELEERRKVWMTKFPEGTVLDIGEEALLRQICGLEVDISHDRAAHRSSAQNINTLNTLLGSANWKPAQKSSKDEDEENDNTPFGSWIRIWENSRPIPEADPELQDVDGIVKYISTWFFGHAAKMLGKKNLYSKLYENEISKLRVAHPEFEDEDDEELLNLLYSSSGDDMSG